LVDGYCKGKQLLICCHKNLSFEKFVVNLILMLTFEAYDISGDLIWTTDRGKSLAAVKSLNDGFVCIATL